MHTSCPPEEVLRRLRAHTCRRPWEPCSGEALFIGCISAREPAAFSITPLTPGRRWFRPALRGCVAPEGDGSVIRMEVCREPEELPETALLPGAAAFLCLWYAGTDLQSRLRPGLELLAIFRTALALLWIGCLHAPLKELCICLHQLWDAGEEPAAT